MSEQVNLFDKNSKGFKKNTKEKEANVQLQVCKYLKLQYPNVIFTCDLASGMNLGKWIGGMNARMRSSRGLPDLFIAHSKRTTVTDSDGDKLIEDCAGLFIELKKSSARLKNGGIAKSPHHDEQEAILKRLREQHFVAEFACGFEEAKKLIDEYLN